MKIGYVRVSKHEQNEALQIDALKAAGCEKWFLDKITGSKAERKGLNEALAYVRPGDAFMVWKLDRAGLTSNSRPPALRLRSSRFTQSAASTARRPGRKEHSP